ncbi:hypothetical protein OPV22_005998 [Ensete ventricosum]|uniref:Uncharacterized protein n=1 Tax=Ensete ventricosum TaxID=4639 RepID=A0AAV8RKD7_ENSVE|nr:hypothetical protein OPV22_005998 [Ensete ventricosum]
MNHQSSELPVTPPGCPAANPIAVADGGTTGNAVAASPPAAEADRHHQLAAAAAADLSFRWPPTGAEDAQITQVLYGRSQRRRLPVFTQFCPSDSHCHHSHPTNTV